MILWLMLTPESLGARPLRAALAGAAGDLADAGIRVSQALGAGNHTKLVMAATDPAHVDPLRHARGYAAPARQVALREAVMRALGDEIAATGPGHLVLSSAQLVTTLVRPAEIARLHAMLAPLADEVRLVLHLDEQARVMVRVLAEQVMAGRSAGLDQELTLAARSGAGGWAEAALAARAPVEPALNRFPEVHAAPHWLDYARLVADWGAIFGAEALRLRPAPDRPTAEAQMAELTAIFALPDTALAGAAPKPAPMPPPAPADWLRRCRDMNWLFERALASGRVIPRPLWRRMLEELAPARAGEPLAPGSLAPLSQAFAAGNGALVAADPALAATLTPDAALADWTDAPAGGGFRASQYLAVFLPRIDAATAEARAAAPAAAAAPARPAFADLPPEVAAILPASARDNHTRLSGSRFAPDNRIAPPEAENPGPAYAEVAPRVLPAGNSGNVIIACMKNEGPYIVEWIAYHRAIGVDNFLIYSNGCEDGTDAILDRLQAMGIVEHRNNDDWKGKSPQQAALNRSMAEPLVREAEWLAHVDVDEFINIRTGNGTLSDLYAAIPGASNVAMTWRLFGHNGVTAIEDRPVIAQFDHAAPAWCPKPHTVWGFKTLFRNLGAYAKLSCHRPNKIAEPLRDQVRWVNGAGRPMKDSFRDSGWRSSMDNIGYDLVQLNHYALRSADSFLIKRQRGRALHVDRAIGLNYWIRMDWNDHPDRSILRNLPRLRAAMAGLMADEGLARAHHAALDWHRARASELHGIAEYRELYEQALATRLDATERVAYGLALDMES